MQALSAKIVDAERCTAERKEKGAEKQVNVQAQSQCVDNLKRRLM